MVPCELVVCEVQFQQGGQLPEDRTVLEVRREGVWYLLSWLCERSSSRRVGSFPKAAESMVSRLL